MNTYRPEKENIHILLMLLRTVDNCLWRIFRMRYKITRKIDYTHKIRALLQFFLNREIYIFFYGTITLEI